MKPLVTVIVPHHLNENDKYLNWCLTSILSSVDVDLDVICLSDAEHAPHTPDGVTLVHDRTLSNVTRKWHQGLKMADPKSKYVMLVSDDVMVSRWTIGEMARTIGDNHMILNPASNCDATTRYYATFDLDGWPIPHKLTLEQLEGREMRVMDFTPGRRILIDPGWVSWYCTMLPKSVIEKVGLLDERLDVRHNDVDYCHRARQQGIPSLIHLGVFALHFGDQTLPKCTKPEEYQAADKAFQEKYMPTPQEDGDLL